MAHSIEKQKRRINLKGRDRQTDTRTSGQMDRQTDRVIIVDNMLGAEINKQTEIKT